MTLPKAFSVFRLLVPTVIPSSLAGVPSFSRRVVFSRLLSNTQIMNLSHDMTFCAGIPMKRYCHTIRDKNKDNSSSRERRDKNKDNSSSWRPPHKLSDGEKILCSLIQILILPWQIEYTVKAIDKIRELRKS
jgi:hypothetical protein